MSHNPLSELKRRLEDDATPLPKRLCLAKNIVLSHFFPAGQKESVVAIWLQKITEQNLLDSKELKDVIRWVSVEDVTSELKCQLIQVISQFLQKNPLQGDIIPHLLSFLDNDKISSQLTQQIDDYLTITITLLKYLREQEKINSSLSNSLLNNMVKYYKACKKKLEFIVKLLDGTNIETVFTYLNTECHETVINVCQSILFPLNKKTFFVSFLQTLIRKDSIEDLIAEKGDNIQSVLKIMTAFFTFPKGRSQKNQKFLSDFVEVFVSCFKKESQLIFAFYIMAVSSLNMKQSYLSPNMKMPVIIFEENDEKIKRNLFLLMLQVLLNNEVDMNVRLTDTFGEKVSKVEIKKNFGSFLQAVMMGQLKLEGKLDRATLEIIKIALKLDPILIEQKISQILPPIMTAKKNNANVDLAYREMMNCVLETLFKLSRGPVFMNQILPHVKLSLEGSNTDQFELLQKIKESPENEKLKNKLITAYDILPHECIEVYGKLTCELMFRQNKELLGCLQKDFEEHCLMMLEEGFVSPSIIILAEVLSAILSSFLHHSKMADHTVPRQISQDFWDAFRKFEEECLAKFGECTLKLNYNPQLASSFLTICLGVAHLKLLNMKYSNIKLEVAESSLSNVYDLSALLPCLNAEQWLLLAKKINEDETVLILDNLLLVRTVAAQLQSSKTCQSPETQTYLINQWTTNCIDLFTRYASVLLTNIEKSEMRLVARNLIKQQILTPERAILQHDTIKNNRPLLNALVLETAKHIMKCFDNTDDLTKALGKPNFNIASFAEIVDMNEYLQQISLKEEQEDIISDYLTVLKHLQLPYLEENYQLVGIFVVLASKMCCQKKIRKTVDHILLSIYELTPKYPDIYKIFSPKSVFSFEETFLLDLLTLKIKSLNNMFVIKCILENAVKKVKTDSEVVKTIVELLLKKRKSKDKASSSTEYFSDSVFQITCIILPIILKERRAITTSAYRSILANLQEKLQKSMLHVFKNIDFGHNSSLFDETTGNIDESMVVSVNKLATLNAMTAYSLTLSKYCETSDVDELQNLDFLWSGLELFVQSAIKTLLNPKAKTQHIDSSIQLLNVILRQIKKLETHTIFENKDQLFIQIWNSIITRLTVIYGQDMRVQMDDIAVTLKFLCECTSDTCFVHTLIPDLAKLAVFTKPAELKENGDLLVSHKVSRHLWTQILKANITGPKCAELSKLLSRMCKDLRSFIRTNYEDSKMRSDNDLKLIIVDDEIVDLVKINLGVVSEAVLAAKKVTLDYKQLDAIFSLQHSILFIMGLRTLSTSSQISWRSFIQLYQAAVGILNSLLMSREELLEDRWPNYMQCYRGLITLLCERASSHAQLDRDSEQKLAEIAHSLEKLTQSICKRRTHVTRIAAYTVGDICSLLERSAPNKMVRQHLENSAALLLQAADSTYSAAFLRRALASSPGHVTLANMYTLYKRYHKYTGNA